MATLKLAIHYLSKNLDASSKGTVICTGSMAGIYRCPVAPLYASTKHAITGLVRSLARPLERENIQINALAPSVIRKEDDSGEIVPELALNRSRDKPRCRKVEFNSSKDGLDSHVNSDRCCSIVD
jgi:NAD(P)-dependent dehydrogenase (short-subunit alcohol dehydrogenase family)